MTGIFSRETIPVWLITLLSLATLASMVATAPRSREDSLFIVVGLVFLHVYAVRRRYQVKKLSPADRKYLRSTLVAAVVISIAALFYLSTSTPSQPVSTFLCGAMAVFPAAVGQVLFSERN